MMSLPARFFGFMSRSMPDMMFPFPAIIVGRRSRFLRWLQMLQGAAQILWMISNAHFFFHSFHARDGQPFWMRSNSRQLLQWTVGVGDTNSG